MTVYRLLDTLAPLAAMPAAIVLTNLGQMPRGIEEFLSVRVSVKNLLLVFGFLLCWRVCCQLWRLYDWNLICVPGDEVRRVLAAALSVTPFTVAFPATSVSGAFDWHTLVVFWGVTILSMLAPRLAFRTIARARRRPARNVIIAGSGPRAALVEQRLLADPDVAYRVVGFADSCAAAVAHELEQRLVTDLSDIERLLMHQPIDEVVIALPLKSQYAAIERLVERCELLGVQVTLPADPLRSSRSTFQPGDSATLLAVTLGKTPAEFRYLVKRWMDVLGAAAALVLFGPLMLGVAAAVKLTSRGPILFVQERYGYNRRRFGMYKFRTMVADAESLQAAVEHLNEAPGPLFKIRDDPRLTPIGGFLRRSSIDELPQLFNVLRGEMSLVGPRPMAVRDVLRFTESALARRFSVKPGMTGLWQVRGRSRLPYEAWATLDLRYVDEWSIGLDLRILAETVPAVVRGAGAE